ADSTYDVDFVLTLNAETRQIEGEIRLGKGAEQLIELDLDANPKRYSGFEVSSGSLELADGRALWKPDGKGVLRYTARVDEIRGHGRYRARFADSWAIFRADRVIPAARVRSRPGATSISHLRLITPDKWRQDTPYPMTTSHRYRVDIPERRFDRPVGWMIAGRIGIRRDTIAGVEISIAAPVGRDVRRMDAMTLLGHTIPEMKRAFGKLPTKILIVVGPEPMWRGGLSAPNSLFLHADRPLVSQNATSTLLHELTHVITRIRGKSERDDWIAEGLAEYYSLQLLLRSGGITQARYDKGIGFQQRWGKAVTNLRNKKGSKGPITARAVVLLAAVDQEIRDLSGDQHSLDDLVQQFKSGSREVSTKAFIAAADRLAGAPVQALRSPLLELP
ncbi:MAG: hypothetical protein KDI71_09280, partial [Xanthomonadales bacterium]|nr:hypothetical protein [Xanthomonadales bacterium]